MSEALRRLENLLSGATTAPQRFAPNSRYHGLPTLIRPGDMAGGSAGRAVAYLARRFIAPAGEASPAHVHTVVQGDRLDALAQTYLGDPEQWWKIADANGAMRPDELTDRPGRPLAITLPGRYPGPAGVA